jgi:hypothetical protein
MSDQIEAIGALLIEAEQAHGAYEATELGGVYDEEWPRWYAAYAVEHGIGEMVGHDVHTDRLAAFLAAAFDEFKAIEPEPAEPWSAYLARRVATEL